MAGTRLKVRLRVVRVRAPVRRAPHAWGLHLLGPRLTAGHRWARRPVSRTDPPRRVHPAVVQVVGRRPGRPRNTSRLRRARPHHR